MDYIKSIEAWAKNHGLDKSNSDKQIDSIGDIFVVLTIYALQNDLHLDDCVKEAYDTIKYRHGKMIDGVFVKNSDLEE